MHSCARLFCYHRCFPERHKAQQHTSQEVQKANECFRLKVQHHRLVERRKKTPSHHIDNCSLERIKFTGRFKSLKVNNALALLLEQLGQIFLPLSRTQTFLETSLKPWVNPIFLSVLKCYWGSLFMHSTIHVKTASKSPVPST